MRYPLIFFCVLIFLSLFSSCGHENADEQKAIPASGDIISSVEMVEVLEDIYLAEGAVNNKELNANNPKYFAFHYYCNVLKNHNLTADQFMKSYKFFSSDADEMIKILDLIIIDLSQKQGLLQGNTQTAKP